MARPKMIQQELDACLLEACTIGSVRYAKLALANGANANARDHHQNTPMHWAIITGNLDLIHLLIDSAAGRRQDHADRIAEERKHKGPPQVGG